MENQQRLFQPKYLACQDLGIQKRMLSKLLHRLFLSMEAQSSDVGPVVSLQSKRIHYSLRSAEYVQYK